ncbi:phage tail assembly protein [Escherichia coli O145:H28]|nr:phage tail assembly protein [Escherichia coli O145:H28]
MPDFEREDDWWRNGQNLYLDNMAVTGFYRVPLSSAQAGDILLCSDESPNDFGKNH